jgi:hypothetical protein
MIAITRKELKSRDGWRKYPWRRDSVQYMKRIPHSKGSCVRVIFYGGDETSDDGEKIEEQLQMYCLWPLHLTKPEIDELIVLLTKGLD